MSKVRILYDFQAEGSNELTAYTGEELHVINANMFDGWLQVKNMRGAEGIVPSSYVEYITSNNDDDDIPPPPSSSYVNAPAWSTTSPASTMPTSNSFSSASYANNPPSYQNQSSVPWGNANSTNSSWGNTSANSSWNTTSNNNTQKNSTTTGTINKARQHNSDDYDSDDFDEDDVPGSSHHGNTGSKSTLPTSAANMSNSGTLKPAKVRNSFGLDVFLLYGAVKNVPDSDRFSSIILNEQRQSVWKRQSPPYQISIIGYQSDKKYHGVKKFTTYEIQAKIFPQKVRRRYNHFDWLHKRLEEKFGYSICIPPLPDKAVTGNFEDEFIAKRKAGLELWLNRMSQHPVIGQSEVFVHFLQCDDTSSKWKAGKRKAEKDEYRGAQWFCTLTVPGESVDTTVNIKERVEKFSRATNHLDSCMKNVSTALEKIAAVHSTDYKKNFLYLGKKLEEFGTSLSNDSLDAPNNGLLSTALVTVANTYTQIGNLYGEQSKTDINLLLDRFALYRGIVQQMPSIVQFEKSSIQMYEEFQQKPEKLEGRPFVEVAPRREIISHVTFAEINQFNRDKVDDFNQYMKQFLQQQIAFYTEITECLKRAHASFEKIPSASPTSTGNQSIRR